jgi:hypothetical protein
METNEESRHAVEFVWHILPSLDAGVATSGGKVRKEYE